MKRLFTFLFFGIFLLSVWGCTVLSPVYFGSKQAKVQMDLAEQIMSSPEIVWEASLKATEELAIIIDEHEFNQKKGLISGHRGKLNFIRIHVEQLEPELTLVGIQARTSVFPLTDKGIDRELARMIMEKIKKNLDPMTLFIGGTK